jgi:hypothetical protein
MRWERGRAEIDQLIKNGELQRVPPSRENADLLIEQARVHLRGAERVCDYDPVLAYTALYDAARKGLTAVLENQGLRPTTTGGHVAPYKAVMAQLHPPAGPKLRPFDRMRRARHQAEYPDFRSPEITVSDVRADLPAAAAIVEVCAMVLGQMSPY